MNQKHSVIQTLKFVPKVLTLDKLHLIHPSSKHPMVIQGSLNISSVQSIAPQLSDVRANLADRWIRRAEWNSDQFSDGTWNESQPDWMATTKHPGLSTPSRHPDADPENSPIYHRGLSLKERLTRSLSLLQRKLFRLVATVRVLQQMHTLNITPFKHIADKLETLENVRKYEKPNHGNINGGAVRTPTPGFGQGRGKPQLSADRRTDVRVDANRRVNGQTCNNTRAGIAKCNGDPRRHGEARVGFASNGTSVTEIRLDMSNSGTSSISRGKLIRIILETLRAISPLNVIGASLVKGGSVCAWLDENVIMISPTGQLALHGDMANFRVFIEKLENTLDVTFAPDVDEEDIEPEW